MKLIDATKLIGTPITYKTRDGFHTTVKPEDIRTVYGRVELKVTKPDKTQHWIDSAQIVEEELMQ
jgi:hypothetical protein